MPIFILLFTLLLSSCKTKNNSLSTEQKSISESTVSLSIADPDGQSLIRHKLLNIIVQNSLQKPLLSNDHAIAKGDELIVGDKKSTMSFGEERDFSQNEKWLSKVVVSFHDRLEIYFVKDGLYVSKLPELLGLHAGAERVFRWVDVPLSKTSKGHTYYLVSLNREDLMENDSQFFQEEINLSEGHSGKVFHILKRQKVEVMVDYEYSVQAGAIQEFSGRFITRCTRDMMDTGLCGPCYYKRLMPGGAYEKSEVKDLNQLGFAISINENQFPLSSLSASKGPSNQFQFSLKRDEAFDLEIKPGNSSSEERTSRNSEMPAGCKSGHNANTELFASKSIFKIKIKVLGRGEALHSLVF